MVVGAAIGHGVNSEPLALAFLALAAGAILYCVLEIWGGAKRHLTPTLATTFVSVGFFVAFGSELIIDLARG